MIRRSWFQAAIVVALVATASLLSGCFTNEDPATPTNEGPCEYYPTLEELRKKYKDDYEIPPEHNRDPDSHIDEWVRMGMTTWAGDESYHPGGQPQVYMGWHERSEDPLLTVYTELLCGYHDTIRNRTSLFPNMTWDEVAKRTSFKIQVHETLANRTQAALWAEYEHQTGFTKYELAEMDYVMFVHFDDHYYAPTYSEYHVTR